MKSNELRIGNWVEQPNNGVTRVTAILNDLQIKTETGYVDKYCMPIPLTEEWLLKFGFELDIEDGGYQKGKYKVSVSDEGCLFFIYIGYYPEEIAEFKYVHQLQNLYFALTGEELELKEKQDA